MQDVHPPPPDFSPSEHAPNFVLVKVAIGEETGVNRSLLEIPGVSGVHMVYGEYDFVLIIRERESKKFRDIVMKNIRATKGVMSTTTLISAESG